ncbi:MAG: DUF6461 domain-containing protein [Terracoccus sp.]
MNVDERVALASRLLRTLGPFYSPEAFCFALVPDATLDEVLAAYGGGEAAQQSTTWGDEGTYDDWGGAHVVLLEVEGAVIALENNQWEGVRPEVMRRLSRGRRAAGLYRNVNFVNRLALFEDGDELIDDEVNVVEQIPPHLETYFAGVDLEADPVEGAPYETCGWSVANVTAMERFTGRRFDGPPPSADTLAHRIQPWPDEPRPTGDTSVLDDSGRDVLRLPAYREGTALLGVEAFLRLVASVRAATPTQRRRISAQAVWWSLREAPLPTAYANVAYELDHLTTMFAVAGLIQEVTASRSRDAQLLVEWEPFNDAQLEAWGTLIHAQYPDTGEAALRTLCHAATIKAVQGPGLEAWLTTFIADASGSP